MDGFGNIVVSLICIIGGVGGVIYIMVSGNKRNMIEKIRSEKPKKTSDGIFFIMSFLLFLYVAFPVISFGNVFFLIIILVFFFLVIKK